MPAEDLEELRIFLLLVLRRKGHKSSVQRVGSGGGAANDDAITCPGLPRQAALSALEMASDTTASIKQPSIQSIHY